MLMHRPQTPQPGFGSITLLQKFTPHFKILDPRLEGCLSTEGSPLPLSYTVRHVAVSNLDHLLSVIRIKKKLALPENLGKTTSQKLFMLYLVKIVGIKF